MNIKITNQTIISFCEKYPSFSIEKLALHFVENVTELNLCDISDILPFIQTTINTNSELIKKVIIDSSKDTREIISNDLISSTRNIKNSIESSVTDLQNNISGNLKDSLSNIIKTVPNDTMINYCKDLMTKIDIKGAQDEASEKVITELDSVLRDYISSFKTGSVKGRNAEIKVQVQLESLFPKHDIVHVPSLQQKGKMDLILSRVGFPDISIDVKNYSKSVPKTEILKFECDMALGETHAILLSVSSKIVGKPHFTVDIVQGKVAVYLSSCTSSNVDIECMKAAADIIYNLDKVLEDSKVGGDSITISSCTLEKIQTIINQDAVIIKGIKDNLNAVMSQVKKLSGARIISLIQ